MIREISPINEPRNLNPHQRREWIHTDLEMIEHWLIGSASLTLPHPEQLISPQKLHFIYLFYVHNQNQEIWSGKVLCSISDSDNQFTFIHTNFAQFLQHIDAVN